MTKKAFLTGSLSTGILFSLWSLAAHIMAAPFILPTPETVFADSFRLVQTPSFISTLSATGARGCVAFCISLVFSVILGLPSGLSDTFSTALNPWMTVIKATPVVAFILIALLWFGSSIVPVFVSILMTLPVMTEAIAQGVRSSDRNLLAMARVYHFRRRDILLHIQLPSALPYFLGGAGASLGLTWKVVVAGEILSSPHLGIGSAMQTAKVHLETPRVFSLTLTAIFLSILTELLFNFLVRLTGRRSGKKTGEA